MKISEFKAKWEVDIRDSEIQRQKIWNDKFKVELLESVLAGFPIEAITLFKEDSRNYWEIINGKQRVYALEAFWKGEMSVNNAYHKMLSEEKQKQFWNYDLTIIYATGSFEDKVNLYNKINQNIVPLKPFELLRAQFYGNLVVEITQYTTTAIVRDVLKANNRGDNEMIILNIIRQNNDIYSFLKKNKDETFAKFLKLPEQIFRFINDIFKRKNRINLLIELAQEYQNNKRELANNRDAITNDIHRLEKSIHVEGWNVHSEYERILDRYSISKDKKRTFSEEIKQDLWNEEYPKENKVMCKLCLNIIDNYDEAEVDHKLPWVRGGLTEKSNGQLTHKYCNRSKGSKAYY